VKRDFSYGVIPISFFPGESSPRYLILLQRGGFWSFPKGHGEEGETPQDAAMREFREETGISEVQLLDTKPISIEFLIKNRTQKKTVTLFIGYVRNTEVTHQVEEIQEPAWLPFNGALSKFKQSINAKALRTAHQQVRALQRAGELEEFR
jgi:bis(5'-nucleosidyl)-tetraphosphatase